jgi:hypothetical protein
MNWMELARWRGLAFSPAIHPSRPVQCYLFIQLFHPETPQCYGIGPENPTVAPQGWIMEHYRVILFAWNVCRSFSALYMLVLWMPFQKPQTLFYLKTYCRLYSLFLVYSSCNILEWLRIKVWWAKYVARMGETRNRPTDILFVNCTWKDNIKINITELGFKRLNGIEVRFEVLTASSMKMTVFWVVAPCSLLEVYRRFRGTCCLHHQGSE